MLLFYELAEFQGYFFDSLEKKGKKIIFSIIILVNLD